MHPHKSCPHLRRVYVVPQKVCLHFAADHTLTEELVRGQILDLLKDVQLDVECWSTCPLQAYLGQLVIISQIVVRIDERLES